MRTPQPGDYFAIQTHGIAALAIQVGTRSRWNHAAIYVGDGRIVEAKPRGVVYSPITDYARTDYVISAVPFDAWQRQKIVAAADRLVAARVGYGWLDIVALAAVQFGRCPAWLENRAKRDDRLVCSQVVSSCWAAAGVEAVPGKDPWAVTPGDLAAAELVSLAA